MTEIDSLKINNFSFSKKFGQNFIFDKNLLASIVEQSGIKSTDEVLEIGPGAGTLTKFIAHSCKKVVSYEIDTSLKPILEQNLSNEKNCTIVFKDALKTNLEEIEQNFEKNYKIIANLPYYITTPLIFKFLKSQRMESMCIMVQKEVGQRLVAKNKSSDYGAISVILDFYGSVKILKQVPRQMFVPAPNVDSCVVKIDIIKNKYETNNELFEKVVKSAFASRRKTLANNLANDFLISKKQAYNMLKELNLPEQIRGECLSTSAFVQISQYFDKNSIKSK